MCPLFIEMSRFMKLASIVLFGIMANSSAQNDGETFTSDEGCINETSIAGGNKYNIFAMWNDTDGAIDPSKINKLVDGNGGNNSYSNAVYPEFDTPYATQVNVSVFVKNFGSVSEANLNFDVELYVTFSWRDRRLIFKDDDELTDGNENTYFQLLSSDEQSKIWVPPVFFSNSKKALQPNVIRNNTVLFVMPKGDVVYRTRVILTASCPMDLKLFPFDKQLCPLEVSLFGYYDNQVKFDWGIPYVIHEMLGKPPLPPVELSSKISWAKFSLENTTFGRDASGSNWQGVCTNYSSCLKIQFDLQRRYSFYMVDTYLPSSLIVMLGLLSLWIDLDAVPGRVALCVTTLLTLQSTTTNIRAKLPEVSYTKSVDVWLVGCQLTIFLVLLEFVVLHTLSSTGGTYSIAETFIRANKRAASSHMQFGNGANYEQKLAILAREQHRLEEKELLKIKARKADKMLRVFLPLCFAVFAAVYFIWYLGV